MIPGALANPPNLLSFELDGNIAQDGGGLATPTYDWTNFFGTTGNNLTPPSSAWSDQKFVQDFSTTTDHKGNTVFDTSDPSTFTVGSKDTLDISQWSCTASNNVTDKGDIMNAYAVMYTDPSSGHKFMYFGLERNANTGDANVAFWFLLGSASCSTASGTSLWSGNHQNGDLLVVSSFTKGGTVSNINAYDWVGGANGYLNPTPVASGGDCRDQTQTYDTTCATANTGTLSGIPWLTDNKTDGVGHQLQSGEFFEGGIDLTNAGFTDVCFQDFIADTRSSQSLTATLYDYALGQLPGCTASIVTTPKGSDGTSAPPASITTSGSVQVTDSAVVTVSGVDTWAGNVKFYLCGPLATGNCSSGGTQIGATGGVPVDNTTTQPVVSDPATITSAGRYCWRARFHATSPATGIPDATDPNADSLNPNSECFTVNPVTPEISTAAVASPVDFGNPVQDNATLTGTANEPGGGPAQGDITFTLYKSDCKTLATGTGTNPQTVSISGDNTYGPVSFTPDAPGTYYWDATYPGDSPNTNAATDNSSCPSSAEEVVVRQIPTTMSTAQKVFPQDSATIASSLSGNALPAGGTVTFRLYKSTVAADGNTALDNCQAHGDTVGSGGLIYKEPITTTGGTTPETLTTSNTTVSVNASDTYYWYVTYATGDTAHSGRQSDCQENTVLTFNNDSGPGTIFPSP